MGRQGEGGGLKILKNEETSFMDDPLPILDLDYQYYIWNRAEVRGLQLFEKIFVDIL